MGEAKDPRRDVPVALAAGLTACAGIYIAVHLVVMTVLPNPSSSARPLADAAGAIVGPAGASLMAAAAIVSIIGILGAGMVNTPRLFFALADGGDFPRVFADVHSRYYTPHVALCVYAAAVFLLALGGTFIWNAVLSAAGRLLTYGLVCGALLRLRRVEPHADAFRVPAGPAVAAAGLAFCGLLVAQMGRGELVAILATMVVALTNWLWVTRRERAPKV
jgi:amino acid transporter